MKNLLTGMMALTFILSFSLEANARGLTKGGNKGRTSVQLKEAKNNQGSSQGTNKAINIAAKAVQKARNIRNVINDTLVYNLEQIITVNPTLKIADKVSATKVSAMVKSLNKLNPVNITFHTKKAIANLKRYLTAEGFTKKQIEELTKETCKI